MSIQPPTLPEARDLARVTMVYGMSLAVRAAARSRGPLGDMLLQAAREAEDLAHWYAWWAGETWADRMEA